MILTREAQPDSAIRIADLVGIGAGQEAVVLATVGASNLDGGFTGVHSCSAYHQVLAQRPLPQKEPDGFLNQLWRFGRSQAPPPKITYGGIPVPDDLPSISLLRMATLFRRNQDGSLWVSPPFSLAYFEVPEEIAQHYNVRDGARTIIRALEIGDMTETFRQIGVQTRRTKLWKNDEAVRMSGFAYDTLQGYSEMAIGR